MSPAHGGAWAAGILHHDISIGNIMIDVEESNATEWCGFLTDWDLCKYKEDLEDHVPCLPGRSVSWARPLFYRLRLQC